MSEYEEPYMSEECDAETSISHQKEVFFGKYKDKDYGIHDDSDTDYTDEDDEDQHYSGKKSKLNPCEFLMELIVSYKTHSMRVYNI